MHIDSGNQPNELYHIIHFLIESIFYSMRRSRRSLTHILSVGLTYFFLLSIISKAQNLSTLIIFFPSCSLGWKWRHWFNKKKTLKRDAKTILQMQIELYAKATIVWNHFFFCLRFFWSFRMESKIEVTPTNFSLVRKPWVFNTPTL